MKTLLKPVTQATAIPESHWDRQYVRLLGKDFPTLAKKKIGEPVSLEFEAKVHRQEASDSGHETTVLLTKAHFHPRKKVGGRDHEERY
jgi:hypothetical protein